MQTLSVVAIFADGPTTIRNIGHIRHKETDRISAIAIELRKLGAEVVRTRRQHHNHAEDIEISHNRDVPRSSHGNELRAGRIAASGYTHHQSGMRIKDVSSVF